jgi:hypothetical protein
MAGFDPDNSLDHTFEILPYFPLAAANPPRRNDYHPAQTPLSRPASTRNLIEMQYF